MLQMRLKTFRNLLDNFPTGPELFLFFYLLVRFTLSKIYNIHFLRKIMVIKWIQKIHLKKGALHRQLGIPEDKQIPISLLNKIIAAKAGDTITNPSKLGRKRIKVTREIEQRAILARNLKNISKKR